ncbi:scavenger receptor class F member 2 [Biomphalaria glabrata]|nr:scavenger receptor class F member 2 [Biomphalaria glabrata]
MRSCLNETYSLQAKETMDVRCNDNVKITILNLVGNLTSLCSFYISGGRNIAYKQKAVQTSTYGSVYGRYHASQAVDGKRLSDGAMCARTNPERSPSLNISLQSVYVIQRFVVQANLDNRYLSNVRLVIRTFDIDKNVVGVSQAVTNPFGQVYNVTLNGSVSQPVALISLSLQGEESSLILCEVQSLGECPAGYWSLPCSKQCPPSCPDNCDRDTGVCNTVCIGYSNPPQCDTVCRNGTWGVNCSNPCSDRCEVTCNTQTGLCDQGCNGFSDRLYCETECSDDSWGINCSQKCSEKCHEIKCNSRTGECYNGCKPGYQLPACTKVCQSGQWGRNCTRSCNLNCYDSDCDSQRGSCLFGCVEGYRLPHCTETCVNGTYGRSCSARCSSSCENAECDPFKGSCYKCAVGYEGSNCELKTFSVEMNSFRIGYAVGTLVTFLIILALLLVKPYLVQWREKFEKPSIYDQADALYEARHNYNDTVEEDNYQDKEDIYQNCVVFQKEVDHGTEEYQNLSEYEFVKPK